MPQYYSRYHLYASRVRDRQKPDDILIQPNREAKYPIISTIQPGPARSEDFKKVETEEQGCGGKDDGLGSLRLLVHGFVKGWIEELRVTRDEQGTREGQSDSLSQPRSSIFNELHVL